MRCTSGCSLAARPGPLEYEWVLLLRTYTFVRRRANAITRRRRRANGRWPGKPISMRHSAVRPFGRSAQILRAARTAAARVSNWEIRFQPGAMRAWPRTPDLLSPRTALEHRQQIQADQMRDPLLVGTRLVLSQLTAQHARVFQRGRGTVPRCVVPPQDRHFTEQIAGFTVSAYAIRHSAPRILAMFFRQRPQCEVSPMHANSFCFNANELLIFWATAQRAALLARSILVQPL